MLSFHFTIAMFPFGKLGQQPGDLQRTIEYAGIVYMPSMTLINGRYDTIWSHVGLIYAYSISKY